MSQGIQAEVITISRDDLDNLFGHWDFALKNLAPAVRAMMPEKPPGFVWHSSTHRFTSIAWSSAEVSAVAQGKLVAEVQAGIPVEITQFKVDDGL